MKFARWDAQEKGVKIPTISSVRIGIEDYAVFLGDNFYEEYNSCCAFYARQEAVYEYIDREEMLNLKETNSAQAK